MGSLLTSLHFCADLKIHSEKMDEGLKRVVHLKINILSSFYSRHSKPGGLFFLFMLLFKLMKSNEA